MAKASCQYIHCVKCLAHILVYRVAKFYVTVLNWSVKKKKEEKIHPYIHVDWFSSTWSMSNTNVQGQFKCDVDIVKKREGYGDGVSLRYQRQNNTTQMTSQVTFVQVASQHPVWAANTLTTSRSHQSYTWGRVMSDWNCRTFSREINRFCCMDLGTRSVQKLYRTGSIYIYINYFKNAITSYVWWMPTSKSNTWVVIPNYS